MHERGPTAIIQLDAKQAATEAEERRKQCEEVGAAVDQGTLGDIVAKHEKLILKYYEDVLQQANQSFKLAKGIARIGACGLVINRATKTASYYNN